MKKTKTKLIIIFLAIISVLFIVISSYWFKATKKFFEYNNFKELVIEEIRENPEESKERYNIESENELTEEILDEMYSDAMKNRYVFIASASLPISIIGSIVLFSPILIIVSIVKKYRKYRLNIDNFKENVGYYRDLLKEYNPLELSYNNNYDLDEHSLIAMSLYIVKKNFLVLQDNKFFINNEKTKKLTGLEKDFIHNCKITDDGRLNISYFKLKNLTEQSCRNKKLLTMGNIPKNKIFNDILKAILCYSILFIIWQNINQILEVLPPIENTFIMFSILGIMLALFLFVFFYPFSLVSKYFVLYLITNIKHSKRTRLGNEINYKLDGLKNYIRDFSLLNEREKEEIAIWDDYLIYSVLFGDNKKIYSEMKDKVKYT